MHEKREARRESFLLSPARLDTCIIPHRAVPVKVVHYCNQTTLSITDPLPRHDALYVRISMHRSYSRL